MPAPFTAPRTSFNATVTPHRIVALHRTSRSRTSRRSRTRFGVKVNDVVIAICSGALRRYLADARRAARPVADRRHPGVGARPRARASEGTTKVSVMFSSLDSDVDDPVERLRAIAETNDAAKEEHELVGAQLLQDWAEHRRAQHVLARGPGLLQPARGRAPSGRAQPHHLQRPRPADPALLRRRQARRAAPARPGDGRRRPQRHGAVQHGRDRLRLHRVPRADARAVGPGRRGAAKRWPSWSSCRAEKETGERLRRPLPLDPARNRPARLEQAPARTSRAEHERCMVAFDVEDRV